jgi:hypothetical protein
MRRGEERSRYYCDCMAYDTMQQLVAGRSNNSLSAAASSLLRRGGCRNGGLRNGRCR